MNVKCRRTCLCPLIHPAPLGISSVANRRAGGHSAAGLHNCREHRVPGVAAGETGGADRAAACRLANLISVNAGRTVALKPLVAPRGSTSDARTLILMRMMLVIPAMRAMQLTAAPAARMHLRDVPGSDIAHNSGPKRGDRGCLRSA